MADLKSASTEVKTEAQLRKEAQKQAKLDKFKAKQEKEKNQAADESKKNTKASKKPDPKEKDTITYELPLIPGEKKCVTNAMPDSYSPRYVEAAWYDWWVKEGFFKPEYGRPINENNPKGRFVMVIPPPNVTGSLHLGHALTNSIEDCITRWHRMCGRTVLWNPGCDHAGIATQVVVEKRLMKERNLSRHDIGRDKFVEEVWSWKQQKGDRIYQQLRILGGSYDWDRARFTMEPTLYRAVTEAFCRLHEQGIIYRSTRLVNWSCALRSAISDIEVDKVEITGRKTFNVPGYKEGVECGVLVTFAYPIVDSEEFIPVATTRVETMLGDTAVAVHPNDPRYAHLHGKFVKHPFCSRLLPIVPDEFVDMNFGTGAVKITPAHDQNDFDVGRRHNLPFLTIIDESGYICGDCGRFNGLHRFAARKAVLQALKDIGLFRDINDNPMTIPICSRSKDIIEPLLKPQWYVNCQTMAQQALDAARSGELRIIPDFHIKTWEHWMTNCRDWCISRQLWWGHRIPAYYVAIEGVPDEPGNRENERYWVSGRTIDEARARAVERFGVTVDKITLHQDEDVLDTWFSSALFPFSVFAWPDNTADLAAFYPGTLLETGWDILFFWVARMVMFGLTLTGQLPFRDVFLHAMIRDAHGRKMTKSLGNVIDPLDVIYGVTLEGLHQQLAESNLDPREIEKARQGQTQDYPNGIPECGTDALRFALVSYTQQSMDINLDVLRIQGYRFFCNKIWNAMRLTLSILGTDYQPANTLPVATKNQLLERWILSRLASSIKVCNDGFNNYELFKVTAAIHQFWLYDFCDWFLEYAKLQCGAQADADPAAATFVKQVLYNCAEVALRLLHPLMPFITEELWQRLPRRLSDGAIPSICVASYPLPGDLGEYDEAVEAQMDFVQTVCKEVRSTRETYSLGKTKVDVDVVAGSAGTLDELRGARQLIKALCYIEQLGESVATDAPELTGCAVATVATQGHHCKVFVHLRGAIDVAKETTKLHERKLRLCDQMDRLNAQMQKEAYQSKVGEDVKKQDLEKLKRFENELTLLQQALENLQLMN